METQTERKVPRCPICGLRIRGKNHDEGPHHRGHFKTRTRLKGRR